MQAFYKRFFGPKRASMSDRQGADARRDAIPGQFVRFWGPGARALAQETSPAPPQGNPPSSTRSPYRASSTSP